MKKTIYVSHYKVSVLAPSNLNNQKNQSIIYTHFSKDDAEAVFEELCEPKPILAAIEGIDWESDLTPFKAKKAFHNGKDFSGGAKDYLDTLCSVIIPETEKQCEISPSSRAIAGYSLAGLFAVFALFNCRLFDKAASVSGSLWFDGFLESILNKTPLKVPKKIYFSCGDTEKFTKSERMAKVETATQKTAELFSSYGSAVRFELNSGGHFKDVSKRIAKGIQYISE